MKTVDILQSKVSADELYVNSLAETDELMDMFADYLLQKRAEDLAEQGLESNARHLTRIEFKANNHDGKSTAIRSLQRAMKADDVHEVSGPTERHQQTLSRSEDFGWVRHYDAMLPEHFRLKASLDPDFWDNRKTGVDISENSEVSIDFDFVVELEKVDREDRSPDGARKFMFYTDLSTHHSQAFQDFMRAAKARFGSAPSTPSEHADITHE